MATSYTEHEQKIAAASKAWRFYQWICSDEFAQHEEDRHVVIAEGAYTGRPGIPLEKKKKRALNDYADALENLRGYERYEKIEHLEEDKVKNFTEERSPNKGRKRGGRAIALQKYIRRIERQIGETKQAPESEFIPNLGRGRPRMSRPEKVNHFEMLIEKAKEELLDEYEEMTQADKIWHEMHDLKTDRRQLRLAISDPKNPQSFRVWEKYESSHLIVEALSDVNALISRKEAQLKMLEAGIDVDKDDDTTNVYSPEKLEEYRRTLDHMIKEQTKIKQLEQKAAELGIDVEKLKRLL